MKGTKIFIAIVSTMILALLLSHIYPFETSGEEKGAGFFIEWQLPGEMYPVFYRDEYNITLLGIERLHPFDSQKYGKVFQLLLESDSIEAGRVVRPCKPDRNFLLKVHTDRYLKSLEKSNNVARITEVPLIGILPGKLLHSRVLNPMLYAAGGTVMAAKAALERGWAINLGGGFHHASADSGGGFCVYSDIALAVAILKDNGEKPIKVMIVDLDAHQGNGHERDLGNDDAVYIFDMYNAYIYPYDIEAKRAIDRKIEVHDGTGDAEYLDILTKELDAAFRDFTPDLIIYNAGSDVLSGDPLGRMDITDQGIIRRDETVFRKALSEKVPIVMLLSGGYQKKNAAVIAKSIQNILSIVPHE